MTDYVLRESVKKVFDTRYEGFQLELEAIPAADVAPVVHAHWVCEWNRPSNITRVICSHCRSHRDIKGCYVSVEGSSLYERDRYCPDCGAKMDELRRKGDKVV